jgi:hypothetical protein
LNSSVRLRRGRFCLFPSGKTIPQVARDLDLTESVRPQGPLEALERHLVRFETRRKRVSLTVRAAQVFAYLLTRGDEPFQRYFLSAPRTTIMRWTTRFQSLRRRTLSGGRPLLDDTIVDLIVTLKRQTRSRDWTTGRR